MYRPPQQREDLQEIRDAEGRLLLRVNAANFRKLERLLRHEEVCGIVSGIADPTGSAEPILEEFTPIAIPWTPNSKGLLEVDKGTLALLLAPFPSAVGYFRYVRQASVEVTVEDARLLNLIFGPERGLLILVQSAMFRVHILHVYQRSAGGAAQLLCRFPIYDVEVEAPPPSGTKPRPEVLEPESLEIPASSGDRYRLPIVIAIALAGLAMGAVLLRMTRPSPTADERATTEQPSARSESKVEAPALPLSTRRTPGRVELLWDPTNPIIRNAVRGSLTVFVNNAERTVPLTPGLLHTGRYSYRAGAVELLFQMVVYAKDESFAVGTIIAEANGVEAPEPRPTSPTIGRTPPRPQTYAEPRSRRVAPPPVSSERLPPPPDREPSTPLTAPSPATQVTLPPASEPKPTPPSPVAVAPPTVTPEPERVPEPVKAPSRSVTFTNPVPKRRPTPAIPAEVRARLAPASAVRVMVHIDPQGKVTEARILEQEDAPKLVIPYVLQAARVWEFEPARRDGTPVESETVILFRFGAQ